MSTPTTSADTASPSSLQTVVSALDAVEQALRDNQVDSLPTHSENLARALQQCQREYADPDSAAGLDLETRQILSAIGARLATLRELLQRQSGSTHRMLAALFPSEQINAYSRLGQGPNGNSTAPRMGSKTSFTA